MPRGNAHGYLGPAGPVKPANQGFQGEAAGGCGSYGASTVSGDSNVKYDPSGTMGKLVASGDASATAKSLIEKTSGMSVESATPASAFPKP